jgi:hypothetical protein
MYASPLRFALLSPFVHLPSFSGTVLSGMADLLCLCRVPMKANRAGTRGSRAPEVLLKCGQQSGGTLGSPLFFRLPSYPLTSTSSHFVPDFFNLNKPVTNLLSFIFMTYSCGRLVCRNHSSVFLDAQISGVPGEQ